MIGAHARRVARSVPRWLWHEDCRRGFAPSRNGVKPVGVRCDAATQRRKHNGSVVDGFC